MISIEGDLSYTNTRHSLKSLAKLDILSRLHEYGRQGVVALRGATPLESGITAESWYYEVFQTKKTVGVVWKNSNVINGAPIAILIQYGHATGTGGFVQGRDYINPVIRPLFQKISTEIWKELRSK